MDGWKVRERNRGERNRGRERKKKDGWERGRERGQEKSHKV